MTILELCADRRQCTGAVPPGQVGATTTVVGRKLYLIGGRSVDTKEITCDVYVLDLDTLDWTKIEPPTGPTPAVRYFHTAAAHGEKVVVFGGMSATGGPAAEKNVVLNDVAIFDTLLQTWAILLGPRQGIPTRTLWPRARYAHLSIVSADRLIVVGGQDLSNNYVQDIATFNLHRHVWTDITAQSTTDGSYRTLVASSPVAPPPTYPPDARTEKNIAGKQARPRDSGKSAATNEAAAAASPNTGRSDAAKPPSRANPVYIYSNHNFTDVRRELRASPPAEDNGIALELIPEASSNDLPPGLRFPTGVIVAGHLLISGTFLTSAKQTFAIWSMHLETGQWQHIDIEAILGSDSWNRGVMCEALERYVLLGNPERDLVEDYHTRRLNFESVCLIDLEAFGIIMPEVPEMSPLAVELGLQFLKDPRFADMEIVTQDHVVIPINSNMLLSRWPGFIQLIRGNVPFVHQVTPPAHLLAHFAKTRSSFSEQALRRSSLIRSASNAGSLYVPSAWRRAQDRSSLQVKTQGSRCMYIAYPSLIVNTLLHWLYAGALPDNVKDSASACCLSLLMVQSLLLWSVHAAVPQPGSETAAQAEDSRSREPSNITMLPFGNSGTLTADDLAALNSRPNTSTTYTPTSVPRTTSTAPIQGYDSTSQGQGGGSSTPPRNSEDFQPPALLAYSRTLRKRLHALLNPQTAPGIYETCVLAGGSYTPPATTGASEDARNPEAGTAPSQRPSTAAPRLVPTNSSPSVPQLSSQSQAAQVPRTSSAPPGQHVQPPQPQQHSAHPQGNNPSAAAAQVQEKPTEQSILQQHLRRQATLAANASHQSAGSNTNSNSNSGGGGGTASSSSNRPSSLASTIRGFSAGTGPYMPAAAAATANSGATTAAAVGSVASARSTIVGDYQPSASSTYAPPAAIAATTAAAASPARAAAAAGVGPGAAAGASRHRPDIVTAGGMRKTCGGLQIRALKQMIETSTAAAAAAAAAAAQASAADDDNSIFASTAPTTDAGTGAGTSAGAGADADAVAAAVARVRIDVDGHVPPEERARAAAVPVQAPSPPSSQRPQHQ